MHTLQIDVLEHTYNECRLGPSEFSDEVITVALTGKHYYFHSGRLKTQLGLIGELLTQLPLKFYQGVGKGGSLETARYNRLGAAWGDISDARTLIILGMAVGAIEEVSICDPMGYAPIIPIVLVKDYLFVDTKGRLRTARGNLG